MNRWGRESICVGSIAPLREQQPLDVLHTYRHFSVGNLTAMLEGKQQPRDHDERIAQIGICRFENRCAALARIDAEAFAADPKLTTKHR